jgi:hypothetical protein
MKKAIWLLHDDAVVVGDIAENYDREPVGVHVKMHDGTMAFVPWANVAVVSEPPEPEAEDQLLKDADALPLT